MSSTSRPETLGEPVTHPEDASLGTLVSQLSSQIPELIRSEIRLAQAEITEKGKRAGIGAGAFGAAGVLGLYGFAALLVTVGLALALVLPAWLSALIVTVVLFGAAGGAAVFGKTKVAEASPPKPEMAIEGIKEDLATVKGQRA